MIILNFEGTLYLERVYSLKNTLNFEDTRKKRDEVKKDSSTQAEKGEKKKNI